MHSLRRLIVILGCLLQCSSAATTTGKPSLESRLAPSTCPARTANYITHSLPQQCLAFSRNSTSTNTLLGQSTSGPTESKSAATGFSEPSHTSSTSSTGTPSVLEPFDAESESTGKSKDLSEPYVEASGLDETASPHGKAYIAVEPHQADSPLENTNFLSFEEWKKQNLLKAGQSEHVGSGRQVPRKRPTNEHDSLDSLGDDGEIDLDFSGFVSDRPDMVVPSHPKRSGQEENSHAENTSDQSPAATSRSKDAGTTSKERFNYASFDCAATVLKTNSKAKGASAVLGENKDKYMLNECSVENKFLILELCDDIAIDTIVLANFEFFSSIFRTFQVSVSAKYPIKNDKWEILGVFEARNIREVQPFLIENSIIWARYLRIEFLTHYGSEFYCPLSLVRVHGTTMYQEFKQSQELASVDDDDNDDDEESGESEMLTTADIVQPDPVTQVLTEEIPGNGDDGGLDSLQDVNLTVQTTLLPSQVVSNPGPTPDTNANPEMCPWVSLSAASTLFSVELNASQTCEATNPPAPKATSHLETAESEVTETAYMATATNITENVTQSRNDTSTTPTQSVKISSSALSKPASATSPRPVSSHHVLEDSASGKGATSESSAISSLSEKAKHSSTATQPMPAAPTMQESFFKSVQKRLQMLESNSSLSLQYIEEQSQALRDAFNRVEQRQLAKTIVFLDSLNSTVLNELRDFRQQYDQLWQSTVIELDNQRELYHQETFAINAHLAILADEVTFQKRMSILQMVLILVCLGLVLFSRGTMHTYLELPAVQNMLRRSPSMRRIMTPGLETPIGSSPSGQPSSSRRLKPTYGILKEHRRGLSEDSADGHIDLTDAYSPPTPPSEESHFDPQSPEDRDPSDSRNFDPTTIERPQTSPPALSGSDEPATPTSTRLRDFDSVDSQMITSSPAQPSEDVLSHARGEISQHGAVIHDQSPINQPTPILVTEVATPPSSKHLTWQLPNR